MQEQSARMLWTFSSQLQGFLSCAMSGVGVIIRTADLPDSSLQTPQNYFDRLGSYRFGGVDVLFLGPRVHASISAWRSLLILVSLCT